MRVAGVVTGGTWFVAGTGTGVGKTQVTAVLAAQLRMKGVDARALKPVVSGFDAADVGSTDTAILLRACGREVTDREVERTSPWRFAAPLAPDMAARREGRSLAPREVVDFCEAARVDAEGVLLIEGVGGVMAPIGEGGTVLDWIGALKVPVILVAGSHLGTISHTLTALKALELEGVRVSAVVISESPASPVAPQETRESIARHSSFEAVHVLPRLRAAPPHSIAEEAPDLTVLLA